MGHLELGDVAPEENEARVRTSRRPMTSTNVVRHGTPTRPELEVDVLGGPQAGVVPTPGAVKVEYRPPLSLILRQKGTRIVSK
ncbi:MAG: hypothetical protein RL199_557 [Pseudomonadota bacterium]|jgi:hypothetical protein